VVTLQESRRSHGNRPPARLQETALAPATLQQTVAMSSRGAGRQRWSPETAVDQTLTSAPAAGVATLQETALAPATAALRSHGAGRQRRSPEIAVDL
jgi:hypothetical protein